jgi:HlyD family secretion protein
MVEEGDNVKKGDIIATVEAENIEAKLEQAKALLGIAATRVEQSKIAYAAQKEQSESQIQQATGAYSSAKAQLTKAKKGARPQQLEQAKELVVQAKEAYEYTKVTYDRLKKLYDEGVIPQQKIDGAKAELEVSKAKYNTAQQQYDLVKEGVQKEDISSAEGLVMQAEAMVNLANVTKLQVSAKEQDMIAAKEQLIQAQAGVNEVMSYLNDSTIKAPVDGTITVKNADNGELVSTGMPVVSISNLKDVWANIKIKESAIANIKIGDTIDVIIPGDNNKVYKGKVTSISSKASYATERATQDKNEKDVVAFTVKIKLDNVDLRLKPGMTATLKLKKTK